METNQFEHLKSFIREIDDFPKPGVSFKDITTLIKDGLAFHETIDAFYARYANSGINKIVAIDARGFIFAAALAYKMGVGMVPIRKRGKLPADRVEIVYDLEYGQDAVEIHLDALEQGEKVLIVDDVLATGGTLAAACQLIKELHAELYEIAVVMELEFLNGRSKLPDCTVYSLIKF